MAHLPGNLRLELARDEARRLLHHVPRRQRVRGRVPLRGLPGRARLGRQHVRGAHAGALRPRGEVGAAQLGGQPSADDHGADPPRPRRGRIRLLGLLTRQRPRGRLHRVRRRRDRHEPRGLQVEQRCDLRRSRVRGLPGTRAEARPCTIRVYERRGDPARRVPRPALGARRGDGEPRQPRGRLRHLRPVGIPRLASTSTPATVSESTCRSTRAS